MREVAVADFAVVGNIFFGYTGVVFGYIRNRLQYIVGSAVGRGGLQEKAVIYIPRTHQLTEKLQDLSAENELAANIVVEPFVVCIGDYLFDFRGMQSVFFYNCTEFFVCAEYRQNVFQLRKILFVIRQNRRRKLYYKI